MEFVLTVHSIVRWLVVLVAVIALFRFALVLAGRAQPNGMDRGLMSGYIGHHRHGRGTGRRLGTLRFSTMRL